MKTSPFTRALLIMIPFILFMADTTPTHMVPMGNTQQSRNPPVIPLLRRDSLIFTTTPKRQAGSI